VAGTLAADVALALVLYARTHSATWVAAALMVGFVVPALASPLSGGLSDRHDRRRILVGSELLGAAAFAAMAFVHAPAGLLVLAFVAALAASPFLPASASILPAVAPAGELPWANARMGVARTVGALVGPAAGGGLYALAGAPAAFAVNAFTFACSALLIATVRGGFRAGRAEDEAQASGFSLEGLRLLFRHPILRPLTLGFVLVDAANGLALPAEVPLARVFGAGGVGYGALVTLWAAGGVAGAHFAPRIVERLDEPRMIAGAAALHTVALGVIAVAPWFALALAGFVCGGIAMSLTGVGEDLLLQRQVPDAVRGRVYAAHTAVVQSSLACPLLIAGALVDALGPRPVFGFAAGSALLGLCVLLTLLGRRARLPA
jgi:MFS family permease